ncbi:MAG: hypothetical protein NZ602_14620 [Thermoguttaceae bacterium]|nr:hypothetical protein [Thermoguttaceae bacterium]MDW8036532.1 hypothetical protein [Thermoguttaceae bacterium]
MSDGKSEAKPFVYIPTKLQEPRRPDPNLPPEEYAKAEQEYEAAMKQYMIESIYGANYEENPAYIARKPYLDAEWEAVKSIIL